MGINKKDPINNKQHYGEITMNRATMSGVLFAFLCIFLTSTSNAALVGRLETSPGSGNYQAFYDDQLNITWTANANINNQMDNYSNQNVWAINLTLGGINDWRLASMDVDNDGTVIDCSSATQAACMDNEYGHLFYYGAGTTHGGGITATSPGVFSDVQSGHYWPSINVVGAQVIGPSFHFGNGTLFNANLIQGSAYAWAVYDGDVANVPLPAAVWLLGSGLFGLICLGRRK